MDDPVDEETLAGALRCDLDQVRTGLAELAAGYDARSAGITLRRVGEGWRLYTREEHAAVVERYLVDGQRSRLTQAALETLAVIAYRQPVTRARVAAIRGVGVDGVMRTLISRGLVSEVGSDPDSGGGLYATTPLFLERLGLTSPGRSPGARPAAARDVVGPGRAPRQLRRGAGARRRGGDRSRGVGDWGAMSAANPNDENTTASGDGWSEDMELAPVHPGDRAPETDGDREGERLQKVLARAGVGSRRVSEDMIEAGRISVNGAVVQVQGMRVDPTRDKIAVDGVRVEIRDDRVTYAMNKPPGVITAMSDDRNRPTVGDMVGDLAPGLVHVGRLDQDTEGLLLLTTDGELAHRLAHPSYGVRKTYLAQVSGSVPRDLHKRLRGGVDLDDGPVKVDSFRVVDTHAGQSVVEVVLHEGRKHIVRRLLAEVGLPVSRLTRTAVGPIELRAMRSGTIRKLSRQELGTLSELVGL